MSDTVTETFNPSDACIAWLSIDLDLLPRTLDTLLTRGGIKRHRLGGTIAFCQAHGRMKQRADVLAFYLAKLDATSTVSADA